jgi:hypothetical protein
LQEQIKKSHHAIAQFHYENREMKKKLAERVSNSSTPKEVSVSKTESTPTVPQSSKGKGKERVAEKSPKTIELPKPTVPLTRSSARKLISRTQAYRRNTCTGPVHRN